MAKRRKHLYLPTLREDAGPKEPTQEGIWEVNTVKILDAISDAIEIDEGSRTRGISSIPDVWARPLMFQAAIRRDSRHPLRPRILREWKGLLSLLALRKLPNFEDKTEIVPVKLPDGKFTTALRNLAPRPVRLDKDHDYSWETVLMIRYGKVPIGAFCPTTLVYTGANYAAELKKTGLKLVDEVGYLQPPEHDDEKLYMAEWLTYLQQKLSPMLNADESNTSGRTWVGLITGLLSDWLGELRAELGVKPGDALDSPDVEVASEPQCPDAARDILETCPVYEVLLHPLQTVSKGEEKPTQIGLDFNRNLSEFRTVVVITASLLRRNSKVWQTTRLTDLGRNAGDAIKEHFFEDFGEKILSCDLSEHNAIWVRAERYFLSDQLLRVRNRSNFFDPGLSKLNLDGRFIFPFKKEILDFFTPEEVTSKLAPEYKEVEDGVRFRFYLPVGGARELIEKVYKRSNAGPEDGTLEELGIPTVDMFPRYIDENWRRYYLLHDNADRINVDPVHPRPRDENQNRKSSSNENEQLSKAPEIVSRRHEDVDSGAQVRVLQMSGDTQRIEKGESAVETSARPRLFGAWPEALEITRVGPARKPLGLILIPRPGDPGGLSRSLLLGVDFGTSNTNVYQRDSYDPDADARSWKFQFGDLVQRITDSDPAQRDDLLELFLVPSRDVELPVPTNLRVFAEAHVDRAFLDYSINFRADFHLPANVFSNIKWDTEQTARGEHYLEVLLILLAVQAAAMRLNEVELSYAYPKAFSMNAVAQLKNQWSVIYKKLFVDERTRLVVVKSESDAPGTRRMAVTTRTDPQPEGIAAGWFFGSPRAIPQLAAARRSEGAVCLDVGGGTTDIAIWFDEKIALDASILLAGRQISEFVRARPRLLELLFDGGAKPLAEALDSPAPFAARLNLVLRKEGDRIGDRLVKYAAHADVQALRRLIALEFAGITFYAATVLAAADKHKAGGELMRNLDESGVSLHWGGNAAKYLNWVDFGRHDPTGLVQKIMGGVVYNTVKDFGAKTTKAGAFLQRQSPRHKSEVAGGLVVRDAAGGGDGDEGSMDIRPDAGDAGAQPRTPVPSLVSGEAILLKDGTRVDALDLISAHTLFNKNDSLFKESTFERMERFVQLYNHLGTNFGLLSNDTSIRLTQYRASISDGVKKHFALAQRVPEDARNIEPIFIMELRILLDILRSS